MTTKKDKGSKVPNLRFPGFEGEWERKKLGDLLEFKNGINASKEQYGKGVKFINVLDILNVDFITYDSIVGMVDVDEATINKYSVSYGDVVFQRSSETREEVGTANVYLDKERTVTFGGFVIRGRKIGDYNPVFLNKLLKTDSARDSITSKSGGSTRYNVGQEILASIALNFPPLPEQDRIASFLSLIDDRIRTQSKIIEELKTLLKSTRQKLIQSNASNVKLNECVLCHSSTLTEAEVLNKNEGTYPVYGATGVIAYSTTNQIDEDAILIIKDGASVGRVQYGKDKFSVIGTLNYLTVKPNVCLKYIYYCLQDFNFDKYKVGSGIPHIYFKDYGENDIYCPSLTEQTIITNCLSVIDEKIEVETNLLTLLNAQKQYLLKNLFI